MLEETGKCSICGEQYKNFGNNPEPLLKNERRCCDWCNNMFVIPARLGYSFNGLEMERLSQILKPFGDGLPSLLTLWAMLTNKSKPEDRPIKEK